MSEQPHRTTPAEITASVVERFDGLPGRAPAARSCRASPRHLHAFASDVELTEDEWHGAIGMLTATGQITDERRQEFILWSDTLGLSMLVDAMAHRAPPARPSRRCSGRSTCRARRCASTARASPSRRRARPPGSTAASSRSDGAPIAGAELDIWQNGDNRLYAVQDPRRPSTTCAAASRPATTARYAFLGGAPGAVPDPRRRAGRRDARRDRPPPLAPGPHPRDRPRAGLPAR